MHFAVKTRNNILPICIYVYIYIYIYRPIGSLARPPPPSASTVRACNLNDDNNDDNNNHDNNEDISVSINAPNNIPDNYLIYIYIYIYMCTYGYYIYITSINNAFHPPSTGLSRTCRDCYYTAYYSI